MSATASSSPWPSYDSLDTPQGSKGGGRSRTRGATAERHARPRALTGAAGEHDVHNPLTAHAHARTHTHAAHVGHRERTATLSGSGIELQQYVPGSLSSSAGGVAESTEVGTSTSSDAVVLEEIDGRDLADLARSTWKRVNTDDQLTASKSASGAGAAKLVQVLLSLTDFRQPQLSTAAFHLLFRQHAQGEELVQAARSVQLITEHSADIYRQMAAHLGRIRRLIAAGAVSQVSPTGDSDVTQEECTRRLGADDAAAMLEQNEQLRRQLVAEQKEQYRELVQTLEALAAPLRTEPVGGGGEQAHMPEAEPGPPPRTRPDAGAHARQGSADGSPPGGAAEHVPLVQVLIDPAQHVVEVESYDAAIAAEFALQSEVQKVAATPSLVKTGIGNRQHTDVADAAVVVCQIFVTRKAPIDSK